MPPAHPASRTILLAALALASLADAGCGDDGGAAGGRGAGDGDGGSSRNNDGGGGGPNGPAEPGGGTSGNASPVPRPDANAIRCGGERCAEAPAALAPLGAVPCCTEADRCGFATMLAPDTCLASDAPGGADPSCPSFTAGAFTWAGCCTSQSECGALDVDGGLGCVANAHLMSAEASCDYDPRNTCARITEIACDGGEDCSRGRQCCGLFDGAGYLRFECADGCAKREAQTGETWSEACHPGDACATEGYACLGSPAYLPETMYRCRDSGPTPRHAGSTAAGEVNCGANVCTAGEKCCVSFPGPVARCTPVGIPCRCDLGTGLDTDAGADDAG